MENLRRDEVAENVSEATRRFGDRLHENTRVEEGARREGRREFREFDVRRSDSYKNREGRRRVTKIRVNEERSLIAKEQPHYDRSTLRLETILTRGGEGVERRRTCAR